MKETFPMDSKYVHSLLFFKTVGAADVEIYLKIIAKSTESDIGKVYPTLLL